MNTKDKQPRTIDGIKERSIQRIWSWFSGLSPAKKVLTVLVCLLIVFGLARLNLLGATGHRVTKVLAPWDLPWLDPQEPVVPLWLTFEVEAQQSRRAGKLGSPLQTGDSIVLTFRTGTQAWLTVFGIDRQGVHPVFGEGLEPVLVEAEKAYAREFHLDDTVGLEVYYAVAATHRFDFESVIRPHLASVVSNNLGKGPATSPLDLDLPAGLSAKHIHFQHVPAPF